LRIAVHFLSRFHTVISRTHFAHEQLQLRRAGRGVGRRTEELRESVSEVKRTELALTTDAGEA